MIRSRLILSILTILILYNRQVSAADLPHSYVDGGTKFTQCKLHGVELSPDRKSIKIDGSITSEISLCFQNLVTSQTKTLYIKSSGAVSREPSYEIGREVIRLGINVIVVGYCFSSCAQYIAVVSPKLVISPGSLLLFHNSANSMKALVDRSSLQKTSMYNDQMREELSLYKSAHVDYALLTAPHLFMHSICLTKSSEPGNVDFEFNSYYAAVHISIHGLQKAGVHVTGYDIVTLKDLYKAIDDGEIKFIGKPAAERLKFISDIVRLDRNNSERIPMC